MPSRRHTHRHTSLLVVIVNGLCVVNVVPPQPAVLDNLLTSMKVVLHGMGVLRINLANSRNKVQSKSYTLQHASHSLTHPLTPSPTSVVFLHSLLLMLFSVLLYLVDAKMATRWQQACSLWTGQQRAHAALCGNLGLEAKPISCAFGRGQNKPVCAQ